jgi:hypothetical protein
MQYKSITDETGQVFDLVPRKKEEVPPPGIKEFTDNSGYISSYGDEWEKNYPSAYMAWAKERIRRGYKITKIQASGNTWTVNEEIILWGDTHIITGFEWLSYGEKWLVNTNKGQRYYLKDASKLPSKPKPVVTLFGVQLFEGDSYWFVDRSFKIHEEKDLNSKDEFSNSCLERCFPSLALAEQYVRNNQPYYPKGLVDALFQVYGWQSWGDVPASNKVIDAIKNFKPKV